MPEELDDETLAFAHRMFDLARAGDTEALTAQVDAGVPANLTNDKGDSLLLLAAYHSHPETVSALLARGADPNRINDRGQTPLAAGVFRRSVPIVTALLGSGASPSLGAPSAWQTAQYFGIPEMVDLLAKQPPTF
jgi:ankyrin repeat protein